jgi:nucleotide-binding universal stress UspA family protein
MLLAQTQNIPVYTIQVIEDLRYEHNPSYPSAFSPVASYGPTTNQIYNERKREQSDDKNVGMDRIEYEQQYLRDLAKDFKVDITTQIAEGRSDQEMIKASKEDDLIITAAVKNPTQKRFFIGKAAENLLHQGKSSILVIR